MKLKKHSPTTKISNFQKTLIINLVIPILLVLFVFVHFSVISSKRLAMLESELSFDYANQVAKMGLIPSQDSLDFFSRGNMISYYDANGQLIKNSGFGYSDADALQNCFELEGKYIIHNKNEYKVTVVKILSENTINAEYLAFYFNATQLYKKMSLPIKAALIGGLIFIFLVNVAIVYYSVKFTSESLKYSLNKNKQLVQDLSHEFNTPLAIISSNISNILTRPKSTVSDISENLTITMEEANRLKRMVRDMLSLSRLDAKQQKYLQTFDLSVMVSELIEPYEMMCKMQNKSMHIDIFPNIVIKCQRDKLKQLMMILLDNAQKYTAEGDSISVSLKTSGTKILFSLKDTGIGVPNDQLQKIFERFYRADNARCNDEKIGGNGLGLAIAENLAQNLDAKLIARNNIPKGFRIDIEMKKNI